MTKSELGQFYTTNADKILGGLVARLKAVLPKNPEFVDPFAGQGDLLNFAAKTFGAVCKGYDIDGKIEAVEHRDSLKTPPAISDHWVITNPPYLARNKSADKSVFDLYSTDDLYKASIQMLVNQEVAGGLIIVPLNFFSSKEYKTREMLLSKYKILQVKVFEESVFDDTDYTVVAFSFVRSTTPIFRQSVEFEFLPRGETKVFELDGHQNYAVGKEWIKALQIAQYSKTKVSRLRHGDKPNSDLLLRALDSGSPDGRIGLAFGDPFYGKDTDRSFATLVFEPPLSKTSQEKLLKAFNRYLEAFRTEYCSLFLNNYRNSTEHYARKRIAFDDAYDLCRYLIHTLKL